MSSKDALVLKAIPYDLKNASLKYSEVSYASSIGRHWYAYRCMSYDEHKRSLKAKRLLDNYEYNNYLIDVCLIYPEDRDRIPALHVPILGSKISEISGFENITAFHAALDHCRKEMYNIEPSVDVFVKTALRLTDDDLAKMTFLERMKLVAYVELITQKEIPGPDTKAKPRKISKALGIDPKGIEHAFSSDSNEEVIQATKDGRAKLIRETESFSAINTKLK